jgi:hypothetical protein
MPSPFNAIATVIPYVITGVKLAERFVKGRKKGPEKKALATAFVLDELRDLVESFKSAEMPDWKSINYLELLLNADGVVSRLDDIVDAVVALMNFIGTFEQPPEKVN